MKVRRIVSTSRFLAPGARNETHAVWQSSLKCQGLRFAVYAHRTVFVSNFIFSSWGWKNSSCKKMSC